MELPLADHYTATVADRATAASLLRRTLDLGLDFKAQPDIYRSRLRPDQVRDLLVEDLPESPSPFEAVLEEFTTCVLPLCKNEASPRFLGFGDTGDDIAALAGGMLALFTQQNLINQSLTRRARRSWRSRCCGGCAS